MKDAPDPIDIAFGAELRCLRTGAGLSLEELGRRIGVTYQQIQKYEMGANRVAVSTLVRLARALDVPASTLIDAASDAQERTSSTLDLALAGRIGALPPEGREGLRRIVDAISAAMGSQKDLAA